MMRSLFSGVAGLKAFQTGMDVIGNNISNVNTYGFKSSRATYRDIYYQTLSGSSNASGNMGGKNATQIGYGAAVASIDKMNDRSGYGSTGNSMDCYIDGEGYFVVRDNAGNEHLTQMGTFGFDSDGNLIDGNKNFVMGYKVKDMTDKAMVGGATVNFDTSNENLLDGYSIEIKFGATAGVAADANNKKITVTVAPDVSPAPTVATKETLQAALRTTWAWTGTAPKRKDNSAIDVSKITVDGAGASDTTRTDKINEATSKVAQAAEFDTSAPTKITNTTSLDSISIGADGSITGEDASGKIVTIGQICIANVPNPGGLTQEGNSYYKAINNTGAVTYHAPGDGSVGALESGGLEMSNVDLANEFANMIITQRAFQANSKIITVADSMLEELVNLKR